MQIGKMLSVLCFIVATNSYATVYKMPPENEALIGSIQYSSPKYGENIATIQQRYDLGFNAIQDANPYVDLVKSVPYGSTLKIPTQHLLPNLPRQGIVVNLPEMRIYYYVPNSHAVYTYPIGIGKIGKTIPITSTEITRKETNPKWIPPDDIREFNLEQGIILPKVMPAGPDNPLGPFAIYMSVPTYLMHSTIFPESVGKRASFGCLRMYESDIKEFFPSVESGIPVAIVNTPVKVAWQKNRLYMEAYKPLEEHGGEYEASLAGMVHMIQETAKDTPTLVDWQAVAFISQERDGVPHDIGVRIN